MNTKEEHPITKIIQCYICHLPITNATMCPKCQKLSCKKCIQVYYNYYYYRQFS